MSKEAMKLALEALENSIGLVEEDYANAVNLYGKYPSRAQRLIGMETMRDDHRKAITALREALAEQPAQQDSTCSNALRIQHKAYPRTCKKCGLGPCVELAQQALDKMAENARELGLDYEPAQPRAWFTVDELNAWAEKKLKENPHWAEQPAQQQEPVAWQYNGILHEFDPSDWATGPVTPLYTSPPAQRKPLSVEQERKHFEYWYSTNAFDYESNPIGSRECGLQWQAWKARAAHNIKENT